MKKNFFITIIILLCLAFISQQTFAQSPNRLKIQKGSKQYLLKFLPGNLVKADNLQTIFKFKMQPGNSGGSIKINGMNYKTGVHYHEGEYYVPLHKFLDFFLVEYKKAGSRTTVVEDNGILSTDMVEEAETYVTPVDSSAFKIKFLDINDHKFIDIEKFAKETGKKFSVNPITGIARFNNRSLNRWIRFKNNNYGYLDDMVLVYGGKIVIGKKGESPKKADMKKQLKYNVTVSFDGQRQYKTENTEEPRGYRVMVKISNDLYEPMPISFDNMVLIDKEGKEHFGSVMVYGGTRGSDNYLDNSSRQKGGAESSRNIKARSMGHVVADFVPPKDMEPDYFIFRYKGVVLLKQDISKDYLP